MRVRSRPAPTAAPTAAVTRRGCSQVSNTLVRRGEGGAHGSSSAARASARGGEVASAPVPPRTSLLCTAGAAGGCGRGEGCTQTRASGKRSEVLLLLRVRRTGRWGRLGTAVLCGAKPSPRGRCLTPAPGVHVRVVLVIEVRLVQVPEGLHLHLGVREQAQLQQQRQPHKPQLGTEGDGSHRLRPQTASAALCRPVRRDLKGVRTRAKRTSFCSHTGTGTTGSLVTTGRGLLWFTLLPEQRPHSTGLGALQLKTEQDQVGQV